MGFFFKLSCAIAAVASVATGNFSAVHIFTTLMLTDFSLFLGNQENLNRIDENQKDQEMMRKMICCSSVNSTTNPFYYLALVDFLFEKKKAYFSNNKDVIALSYDTRNSAKFFNVPSDGIINFNYKVKDQMKKAYVQILNLKTPKKYVFKIYFEPADLRIYESEKRKICEEYDNFLKNSENVYTIKFFIEKGDWIPSVTSRGKYASKEVNLNAQRFTIQKIKENKNISPIFLLGKNVSGKTETCSELSRELKMPLYVINGNFDNAQFQKAWKSIPENSIVDISDLGWRFYRMGLDENLHQIANETLSSADVKTMIQTKRKNVIVIFSSNREYFNKFDLICQGFLSKMEMKIDFDKEKDFIF